MTAFQGIGATGLHQPGGRRAGHRRGADRHGGGAVRRHPGRLLLQPLHRAREAARLGDGRLLARVPQHLRAELRVARCPKSCQRRNPAAAAQRGRRVTTTLAEINVVPLVDVMLVLLIIFMVATPMMQQGIDVNLPVAQRVGPPERHERLFVTVPLSYRKDPRRLYRRRADSRRHPRPSGCARRCSTRPSKEVFLRGDGGVQLQDLLEVMDRLKNGGVEKVGIVTRPPASTGERGSGHGRVSQVLVERMIADDDVGRMLAWSMAAHVRPVGGAAADAVDLDGGAPAPSPSRS